MDGEPKLCNVEHVSEGTDEKGASLLPQLPLVVQADLCSKTLLRLVSFRQGPVSLRNNSERATAGWWPWAEFWARSVLSQCLPAQACPCWFQTSQVLWGISFRLCTNVKPLLKRTHLDGWCYFTPNLGTHSDHVWRVILWRSLNLRAWGETCDWDPEFTSSLINEFIISYTTVVSLPGVDAGGVLLTVLLFCAGTPVSYNDALKQEPPGPVQEPFTFLWSALN